MLFSKVIKNQCLYVYHVTHHWAKTLLLVYMLGYCNLCDRMNLRKNGFVCALWLSVHMKSVIEQGFFHEFAFDNKALKTFVELQIWWKRSKFERRRIRIRTSSHPYSNCPPVANMTCFKPNKSPLINNLINDASAGCCTNCQSHVASSHRRLVQDADNADTITVMALYYNRRRTPQRTIRTNNTLSYRTAPYRTAWSTDGLQPKTTQGLTRALSCCCHNAVT